MTHRRPLGRPRARHNLLLLLLYCLLLVRRVAWRRHGTVLPTMRLIANVLRDCCVQYCRGVLGFQSCPHLALPALGTPGLTLTRFYPLLLLLKLLPRTLWDLLLLLLSKLLPKRLLGLVLGRLCRVLCREVLLRGRQLLMLGSGVLSGRCLGWGRMHWGALLMAGGCLHCWGLWGLAIDRHGLQQL